MNKIFFGALALGTMLAISAGGALAAPPSFQFGVHIGDDDNNGPPPPPPPHFGQGQHFDNHDDDCISTKGIFRRLGNAGYSHFQMVDHDDDGYVVDARKGKRFYELTVDDCSGDIIDIERLHN